MTGSGEEVRPIALVCGSVTSRPGATRGALAEEGFDVAWCAGAEALFQEAMRRAPDLVVYEVSADRTADHEVLEFLRCVCPTAPLVIAGEGGSLESRRRLQDFRPLYFALHPMDRNEWRHIVQAIAHRKRCRPDGPREAFAVSRRDPVA